ncbi:phosphotransferase [Actinomadura atramentaria]|uniref:phosphotransferase n=1 Tax=Actinomadura atramentaria TaxID=1990 RepID=UPI00146E9CF4|nr:phosphotransferase [Actinomadura atramentaria]
MTGQPIDVPPEVIEAASLRWPNLVGPWQRDVLGDLDRICARYRARPVRVFDARYAFVVEIEGPDGPLVARTSPDPASLHQAAVSRRLAELGIGPELVDVIETPTSVWTLASRIEPGNTLSGRSVPLEALVTVFRAMKDQPAPAGTPRLTDWLLSRLRDDNLTDLAPGRTPAPADDRERACRLLDQLGSNAADMLCHGDASPNNLLADEAGQLVLIDPRGVSGDAAYDVAVAAWKTASNELPTTRASDLARLAGLNPRRVRTWLKIADVARV